MSDYRENETPLTSFARSIAREVADGLRRNKIATILATVALIATTVLATTSRYDEGPRYRQILLPDIRQAEDQFFASLRDAQNTDNNEWRVSYFITAERRAGAVLNIAKRHWPRTREAVRAHEDLVRYYELVIEDFAIIRTQMSLDENLDFMAEWRKVQAERWPIHERWTRWVQGHP